MKYVDEYRDLKLARKISRRIQRYAAGGSRAYNFMEVCGTHTNTFFRFGLASLLPESVRLISGPGCPVCVTDTSYIDSALSLSRSKDVIIATYGDMLKVPGTRSSLYEERAAGGDIRIVYSSLDALRIAEQNPSKGIVFLGVGFETTAPTAASAVLEAEKKEIGNFFVYSAHKLIPPAMKALLKDRDINIDGFLLPAHVSAIIGAEAYNFLKRPRVPGVVAGFEPLDMLQGISMLLEQLTSKRAEIEVQYDRVVRRNGNRQAQAVMKKVFAPSDAVWRGLGRIPSSGLKLRRGYKKFDAEIRFNIKNKQDAGDARGCICGEVLKGKNTPPECGLFGKSCTPDHPKGPCMVSGEGSCSIYYKYKGGHDG